MGWDSHNAKHYKGNGKIDIIAEVSDQFNWESETDVYSVLKACSVGSKVYLAVEKAGKQDSKKEVFAVVALTSTKMNDYFNFSEKIMDETCGPNYYKCPKSILKLLTPTDSEWANEWRKKCMDNANKKALSSYPIGTKLQTKYKGEQIELVKAKTTQQKNPIWVNWDIRIRFSSGYLNRVGYTILDNAK